MDIEIRVKMPYVEAVANDRVAIGIRIREDGSMVLGQQSVPDTVEEAEVVAEATLKAIARAKEERDYMLDVQRKQADDNDPQKVRERFMRLCNWLRENTEDTGFKGGIKTTSYQHSYNGVTLNHWCSDGEQSWTLNLDANTLLQEHALIETSDGSVAKVGHLLTSYDPDEFACNIELLEYAEKRCYPAHNGHVVNYTTKPITEFKPGDLINVQKMRGGHGGKLYCQFVKYEKGIVTATVKGHDSGAQWLPTEFTNPGSTVTARLSKCYLWGNTPSDADFNMGHPHCLWFDKDTKHV